MHNKRSSLFLNWEQNYADYLRKTADNPKLKKLKDANVILKAIAYYRKVVLLPVKVNESREIRKELASLSVQEKQAYNLIKKRLTTGKTLKPYLSTGAKKLQDDGLFNEWNIIHAHLGNVSDDKEFADRTWHTLNLTVVGDQAYMLKFAGHGDGNYTDKAVLRIINNNWPQLLNKLNGIKIEHDIPEAKRFKFRKNGYNSLATIQGTPVFPQTGVMSTPGANMKDLKVYEFIITPFFSNLEKIFKACLLDKNGSIGVIIREKHFYFVLVNRPGVLIATLSINNFWKMALLPSGSEQLHWNFQPSVIDAIKFVILFQRTFQIH